MGIDDWLTFIPTPYKDDFVSWLTKRDKRIGSQHFTAGFRSGHDHGYHDGQQGNGSIYEHGSRL